MILQRNREKTRAKGSLGSGLGFTLVEVIAVLIILGVLCAIVASRLASVNTFEARGELDRIKAHLRYAQGKSLRNLAHWGIRFDTAQTYWLFEGSSENKRAIPGEGSTDIALSTLQVSSAPLTVTFDSYGSPGEANVTIITGEGSITVSANTGFIE